MIAKPMRLMRTGLASLAVTGLLLQALPAAYAAPGAATGQVLFGLTFFDEDDLTFLDATSADGLSCAHADVSTMPLFGLAGQLPLTPSQDVAFGLEAAGMGGWASNSSRVAADNAQGQVMVDVDWRVIDLSCGVFLRLSPGGVVRVYAGAGPTLLLGRLHRDALEGEINQYTLADRRSEGIFGYGVYGRVGIEFDIDAGWVGLGARGVLGEMTFDGFTEDVDVNAVQGMVTYARVW